MYKYIFAAHDWPVNYAACAPESARMDGRMAESGLKIAGLVMAGGASSRMGRDKALLRAGKSDFLQLAFAKLSAVADACYVSCAKGLPYAGYPCIEDGLGDCGPAAGIMAALEYAGNLGFDGVLSLACDMPLMRPSLLRAVMNCPRNANQLINVYQSRQTKRLEMLAALYYVDCLPFFQAAIKTGIKSLWRIIPENRQKRLGYGPELEICFMNCNTAGDYARISGLL